MSRRVARRRPQPGLGNPSGDVMIAKAVTARAIKLLISLPVGSLNARVVLLA